MDYNLWLGNVCEILGKDVSYAMLPILTMIFTGRFAMMTDRHLKKPSTMLGSMALSKSIRP